MELCKVTESVPSAITDKNAIRQLHAVIGMSTESAELLDQMKKHIYYGKPLDYENLFEEVGDVMWYLAILCDASDFDFDKILESNIAKLKARYGSKFSTEAATNRNTAKEMEALDYQSNEEKDKKKKKK
jgi:NTP pyrophosphatase (non-canonical NTP hydrolase)